MSEEEKTEYQKLMERYTGPEFYAQMTLAIVNIAGIFIQAKEEEVKKLNEEIKKLKEEKRPIPVVDYSNMWNYQVFNITESLLDLTKVGIISIHPDFVEQLRSFDKEIVAVRDGDKRLIN